MKRLIFFCLIFLIPVLALADGTNPYIIGSGSVAAGGGYTATYDSQSSGSGTSTDTVVVTAPSGISVGDMLVAFTMSETASQVITPPSGFTVVDEPANLLHDAASYYKIADSGDAAAENFTWTFSISTSGLVVHMVCVTKDGGTFVAPTTAGYHNSGSSDSSTGESTGSVNTQDGSVLVCGFANDGNRAISTPPADMTGSAFETPWYVQVGTMAGAAAYQEYATGATVDKTAVWDGSSANVALAVVCYAQ